MPLDLALSAYLSLPFPALVPVFMQLPHSCRPSSLPLCSSSVSVWCRWDCSTEEVTSLPHSLCLCLPPFQTHACFQTLFVVFAAPCLPSGGGASGEPLQWPKTKTHCTLSVANWKDRPSFSHSTIFFHKAQPWLHNMKACLYHLALCLSGFQVKIGKPFCWLCVFLKLNKAFPLMAADSRWDPTLI